MGVKAILVLLPAAALLQGCSTALPDLPPKAPRIVDARTPSESDLYSWMESPNSELVLSYLTAENRYAESYLRPAAYQKDELLREFKAHSVDGTRGEPIVVGDFEYFLEAVPGNAFPDLFRRPLGEEHRNDKEKLIGLPQGINQPEMKLVALKISPDNSMLGYLISTTPSSPNILYLRNLKTGAVKKIEEGVVAFEALSRGQVAYTTISSDGRADRLFITSIDQVVEAGNKGRPPTLSEPDPKFHLKISSSKDGESVFVSSASLTQSKLFFYSSAHSSEPEPLLAAEPGVRRDGYFFSDRVIILENQPGGQRLLRSKKSRGVTKDWFFEEFFATKSDESIESIQAFKDYLVLQIRSGWRSYLKIFSANLNSRDFSPAEDQVISLLSNPNYQSSTLRFKLSSLSRPTKTVLLSLTDLKILRSESASIRDLPGDNVIERSFEIPSSDQTPIGMRVAKPKTPNNRVVLYTYGSYGDAFPIELQSERISLFKRGVGIAVCEPRGGGFRGELFRAAGRGLLKVHGVQDLISCAEWLRDNYSNHPAEVVIEARSAGAILAAAALNQRPGLFAAAILDRPFLDPINVLSNKSLPLSARDVEEFGDPLVAAERDTLNQISPYANLKAQAYPPILVLASYFDREVQSWESAKWVAKSRELRTDSNPLLLITEFAADHSGPIARYKRDQETALKYLFILNL